MTNDKQRLMEIMVKMGYREIKETDRGFKAFNWFDEKRDFRLDMFGTSDTPFYNVVAIEVKQASNDIVKPIQVKHIEEDDNGEYKFILTVLDLLINKTEKQIKELSCLAGC